MRRQRTCHRNSDRETALHVEHTCDIFALILTIKVNATKDLKLSDINSIKKKISIYINIYNEIKFF